jgi:predicted RNA-binding protein YlxR (DUF448 family)
MPNQNSKAGQIPQRTCVICKTKTGQAELLNFYLMDRDLVFDMNKAVQTRKRYVCFRDECLGQLDKWLAKFLRKNGSGGH